MKKDRRTQDPKKEVQSRRFWTFVVEKIHIEADDQFKPRVSVAGYFALCTVMAKGLERDISTEPITPPGLDAIWHLPAWCFNDLRVDEVNARLVVSKFREVFKMPFLEIPAPPLDLPLQKIPPSKRDKIIASMMKDRVKEFSSQPPEVEWEDT